MKGLGSIEVEIVEIDCTKDDRAVQVRTLKRLGDKVVYIGEPRWLWKGDSIGVHPVHFKEF